MCPAQGGSPGKGEPHSRLGAPCPAWWVVQLFNSSWCVTAFHTTTIPQFAVHIVATLPANQCPWLMDSFLSRNSTLGLTTEYLRLIIALVRWLNPLSIWPLILSYPFILKSSGLALPKALDHSAEAGLRWIKCCYISQPWKEPFSLLPLWNLHFCGCCQVRELSRMFVKLPKTVSQATEPVTQNPISHTGFQVGLNKSREMVWEARGKKNIWETTCKNVSLRKQCLVLRIKILLESE